MTTINIILKRTHILGALLFAAKHDIRLNGLLVETSAERTFLVGCDGYRLAVFRGVIDDDVLCNGSAEFIIPRDMLECIKPSRIDAVISLAYDTESKAITLTDGATTRTGTAVDGKYPDFRKVLPRQFNHGPVQFDASFLGDLAKFAKIFGLKTAIGHRLICNKSDKHGGVALVEFDAVPEFRGVIMGFRCDNDNATPGLDSWIARTEPQPLPIAA